jgi:spermidine synthase
MSRAFEVLDHRATPMGDLVLRRRRQLSLNVDLFEIKLGDAFLMSSLFTVSEIALARLGLAALPGDSWDVVVGGLGLGYTARAVLDHRAVGTLLVVEALEAVIDWHVTGLLPLGPELAADPRCRLVQGDLFALAASDTGLDPQTPGRRFDAVLVDIDHTPELWLDPRHQAFYQPEGLQRAAAWLRPGGVFGLWSDGLPDANFTARLAGVFATAHAEPVTFYNPLQDREATQTVYLARTAGR